MARTEYQNEPLRTYGASPEEITFYLVGAGAAAPTFGGGCAGGMVATITRASAGKYSVALSVPVYKVVSHTVSIDDTATPDFSSGTIGPITNEATANGMTFQLNIATSGSAADMAAGRKIRIRLRVQRSYWGVMT